RKIMYEAFAAASTRHNFPIEWVIWDKAPDSKKTIDKVEQEFKELGGTYGHSITVHSADLLNVSGNLGTMGIVNNGSDRTIGGNMWSTKNLDTLEEQLANASGLIGVHSNFNPHLFDHVAAVTYQLEGHNY